MNNDDIHTQLGEINGKLEALYDLKKAINGNGQKGILERLTRTEESLAAFIEATTTTSSNSAEERKATIQAIKDLTENVNSLRDIVADTAKDQENHVKDQNVHSLKMFLSKQNIIIVILSFIIMHTIVPPLNLNQLGVAIGAAIMKLVGLG
jgi:archaellum component FlaC